MLHISKPAFPFVVADPGLAPGSEKHKTLMRNTALRLCVRFDFVTQHPRAFMNVWCFIFHSAAHVVKVAPGHDDANITSIAAADILHDSLSLFVSAGPPRPRGESQQRKDEL
jgi:hypothetical protein